MIFTSFDGKKINIYEWTDVESPRGVVQIVHGMTEHAGRYENFAKFLNKNGYIVIANDHRGHGKTDSDNLGFCEGNMFEDTVRDEAEITKYYKNIYPKLKFFIFGFSYGSFIVQSYISKYNDLINGAVIAGSNKKKDLEIYFGSWVAMLFNLFGFQKKPGKLLERLSFGMYERKFSDKNWKSNDEENNNNLKKDNLCGFICSNRFYADFFNGLKTLYTLDYKKSIRKDLPIFLVAGEDDVVGEMGKGMKKLYNFYKEIEVKDVQLILYKNCRHEFLHNRDGQLERYKDCVNFFDKY